MRPTARLGAAGLLVASAALLGACAPAAAGADTLEASTAPAEPLVFAMPPGTDDPDILGQAEVLMTHIEEATGREVELETPADYLGVVEAVRQGFVDVALMSPFSTALAVANGSVAPLLAWEASDEPASTCYVLADSPIESVEDVAGRQVAFVDPGSTTGYFMPTSLLAEHGLVDGEDYTSTFAGGHDSAMLAMLNGSVDVACTSIADMLIEAGVFTEADVKVIGETAPIPVGVSIVVRTDLDDPTREHLVDGLPDAIAGDGTLELFTGSGAVIDDPDEETYAPLLQVAENVGISLEDLR